MQQLTCKMGFGLFLFILFYYLFISLSKTVVEPLNSKKKSWRKILKNSEKM